MKEGNNNSSETIYDEQRMEQESLNRVLLLQSARKTCWTIKEIETVISLVQNRSYLYDKKHCDYKHNQKKDYAWEEIANILKTKSARQCKKKWNTLRIQQRRIIAQRLKSSSNIRKKSHWHCYDRLQFLIPHMEWACNKDSNNSQETIICNIDIKEYDGNSDDCSGGGDLAEENSRGNNNNNDQIINIDDLTKHSYDNTQEISSSSVVNIHQDDESIKLSSATSSQLYNEQLQQQQQHKQQPTILNCIMIPAVNNNHQQDQHKHQSQLLSSSSPSSSTSTVSLSSSTSLPITTKSYNQYEQIPLKNSNNIILNKSPNKNNDIVGFDPDITNKTHFHTNNSDSGGQQQQSTVKTSPKINELNYFLLDLQQQMARLDDIEQLELKIEIQQLLLNKIRNHYQKK